MEEMEVADLRARLASVGKETYKNSGVFDLFGKDGKRVLRFETHSYGAKIWGTTQTADPLVINAKADPQLGLKVIPLHKAYEFLSDESNWRVWEPWEVVRV